MSATHRDRIERLKRLEQHLPLRNAAPSDYPTGAKLSLKMGDDYGEADPKARRRALQRDLKELIKDGRAEIANPGGRPLRYRRLLDDDPTIWQDLQRLVVDMASQRRLDRLWQHLLGHSEDPVLDETQVRVLPDTQRLRPAALYAKVLTAVVEALARRCVLQVRYQNAEGERSEPRLHPQALVQRGPIVYLFALKNDEEDVRLYALHRMTRAEVLQDRARNKEGFDLDRAVAEGIADFGSGESVALELRVRGYLTEVLRNCELSEDQRIADEPPESGFDIRVWATVPNTGQLLRWLLGAGDNLEVVGPEGLRHVVEVQAAKMARLYREPAAGGTGDALSAPAMGSD